MSQSGVYGSGGSGPVAINQVNGDIGFAAGSTINIVTGQVTGPYANGTPFFTGDDVSTLTWQSYDSNGNLSIGRFPLGQTGSMSNSTNTIYGNSAGSNANFLTTNCFFGNSSGSQMVYGTSNCVFGNLALSNLVGSAISLPSPEFNIAIGDSAGNALTTTESNNIYFNSPGVVSESNVLRIGSATGSGSQQLANAYISGINGVNVGSVASVVSISGDHLGSTVITPGTGITVTPGANTITIASTVSSGIVTIDGNTGSVTGSTVTLTTGASNANGTAVFSGSGTTMTMVATDSGNNTGWGFDCLRNIVGDNNSCYGSTAGFSLTLAGQNCFFGDGAGAGTTTGSDNQAFGYGALGITTGSYNCAIGSAALSGLSGTGSFNLAIGLNAGSGVTGSDSSNIYFNNNGANESNTLRIGKATGSSGQDLAAAFICGINGVNVGSVASVVAISGDQLGSTSITAGTGISVTPGANTITIAATGSSFTWNNVTGSTQAMAVNNGYISNDGATLVTFTLPSTAAIGTTQWVAGNGTGLWTIVENTGQSINFGTLSTTVTTGSLSSTQRYDAVQLVCVVANTTWNVISAQGNLTVV